jgi:hypothetical protein
MSTTVTTRQVNEVLEDYKVHLTGYDASIESTSTRESPRAVSNPPNWPTDHRRVPDYRPIDRSRDAEGRPSGSILPERIFITLMFTGVVVNAVCPLQLELRMITDTSIDNRKDLERDRWTVLSKAV